MIELMITLVVIAILAGITYISYGGWQKNARTTAVKNDLIQAKTAMKNQLNFTNAYPTTVDALGATFKPSPDVALTLKPGYNLPYYTGLNAVQNGVLFYTICGDLVSQGYGVGTNNGGQTEQYISACNVYNHDQLQVNSSWHGHNLNTPVQSNALTSIADSINYNDSWRPNEDQIEKTFYQTWNTRFTTEGGTYPITYFWDSWATSSNGGVMKQPLPTPASTKVGEFCIEASSKQDPTIIMHVTPSTTPSTGTCS